MKTMPEYNQVSLTIGNDVYITLVLVNPDHTEEKIIENAKYKFNRDYSIPTNVMKSFNIEKYVKSSKE